jgi:uncharacterized membrane protein
VANCCLLVILFLLALFLFRWSERACEWVEARAWLKVFLSDNKEIDRKTAKKVHRHLVRKTQLKGITYTQTLADILFGISDAKNGKKPSSTDLGSQAYHVYMRFMS